MTMADACGFEARSARNVERAPLPGRRGVEGDASSDTLLGFQPGRDRSLCDGAWITQRQNAGPIHAAVPASPMHRLAACRRGEHRVVWRGRDGSVSARMRRDAVTLIPAGVEGRLDCDGCMATSVVFLSDDRLRSRAADIGLGDEPHVALRIGVFDPCAASLLELLADCAAAGDAPSRGVARHGVDLLCAHLLRTHSSRSAAHKPKRGLADWQINRVSNFARARLDRPIGLDDLAAQVGLSRYHFCTAFRLATGQTPHDWLIAQRMDKAAELLRDTDLSITMIALEVGYETSSAFAARFRRMTGLTPSEHRRRRL
jgi:AraC family transcriptional regulator